MPATPSTVVYGYYWSKAKPALRIKSGDIVDVETMLTNTPAGFEILPGLAFLAVRKPVTRPIQ